MSLTSGMSILKPLKWCRPHLSQENDKPEWLKTCWPGSERNEAKVWHESQKIKVKTGIWTSFFLILVHSSKLQNSTWPVLTLSPYTTSPTKNFKSASKVLDSNVICNELRVNLWENIIRHSELGGNVCCSINYRYCIFISDYEKPLSSVWHFGLSVGHLIETNRTHPRNNLESC